MAMSTATIAEYLKYYFDSARRVRVTTKQTGKMQTDDGCRAQTVLVGLFAWVVACTLGVFAATAEARTEATDDDCSQYMRFVTQSLELPVNSPCVTLLPDAVQTARKKLAQQHGFWATATGIVGATYDVLGHDQKPQSYHGQSPTAAATLVFALTYDAGRLGLPPGSQFVVGGVANFGTYKLSNPTYVIPAFGVYLPISEHVSLQFGYQVLAEHFYGKLIGLNPGSIVLGPASSMLSQLGIGGFTATPEANIRVNLPGKRFYNRFGVARSTSPEGIFADLEKNPTGLKFTLPGARAVFIDEFGYRVAASGDQRHIWLRAGFIYNTSRFPRQDDLLRLHKSYKYKNFGYYVVGDVQLTQPHPALPYIGWYVNGKLDVARKEVNTFSKDFSLTLYRLGTFASRPLDVFSIGFGKNFFSDTLRRPFKAMGVQTAHASTSVSASYSLRVHDGFYVLTSLTYTDNPTFTPKRPGALSFYFGSTWLF